MKKRFIIGVSIFLIFSGALIGFQTLSNLLSPFKSFTVIVDNQSNLDISAIEIGLIRADSKELYSELIKAGQKQKFKPKLDLKGEGAIYLRYTNDKGHTSEHTICGYTEYLSGNSEMTITDERTTVVQNCM